MNTLLRQFSVMRSLLHHRDSARDEIVAFQNRQLRRLITGAYENVPYYRRLFDQNSLKPNDIQSVSDLPAIPITSKKDLQSLPAKEIISRDVNLKHLVVHMTSGSSGEPFTIRRTWLEEHYQAAFRKRAMHYYGLRITDRQADVENIGPLHLRRNQLLRRAFSVLGLYPKIGVHAMLPLDEIVRTLQNFRPHVVTGYAGVLARVAEFINDSDSQMIQPRFVAVGGEVLTRLMRRQITEAFAAPIFDIYGSHEFNLIAWECKDAGEFHTCDDGMIVEVLKDGRPVATGERGEVVGTNLHSLAMPLIRYRLGDIVTKGLETCQCGQPFSTIRAVQGRMIDYFLLPDGRTIHPYEILLILAKDWVSWIRQYQLIQEGEKRIILRVVPSITLTPQKLALIEKPITALLGQGVEFHMILVPEIQLESNGKFRVSRSLVKSAYDGIDWDDTQTNLSRVFLHNKP
jgi:phenylacetate-CoA ligase